MKQRSKFGWVDFLLGVLLVFFGVYTLLSPRSGLSGLVILYSILAIITGIVDIIFYIRLKSATGFGPTTSLVAGILSVLAGFMLLLNPMLGSWIFGLVFAVWFIAHSISRLANYRIIRTVAGKPAAIVSMVLNIICLILGVLMLINPSVSALSLGFLVALAMIVHGVSNIIEAFSGMGAKDEAEERQNSWL